MGDRWGHSYVPYPRVKSRMNISLKMQLVFENRFHVLIFEQINYFKKKNTSTYILTCKDIDCVTQSVSDIITEDIV